MYIHNRFEKILTVIVIIIQKNARRRRGENWGGIYVRYRLFYNDLIKDVFARIGKGVGPFV